MLGTNGHLYKSTLVVSKGLDVHLMNVVIIYLYGFKDNDICMKIHEGLKCLKEIVQNLVAYNQSSYNDPHMD